MFILVCSKLFCFMCDFNDLKNVCLVWALTFKIFQEVIFPYYFSVFPEFLQQFLEISDEIVISLFLYQIIVERYNIESIYDYISQDRLNNACWVDSISLIMNRLLNLVKFSNNHVKIKLLLSNKSINRRLWMDYIRFHWKYL